MLNGPPQRLHGAQGDEGHPRDAQQRRQIVRQVGPAGIEKKGEIYKGEGRSRPEERDTRRKDSKSQENPAVPSGLPCRVVNRGGLWIRG